MRFLTFVGGVFGRGGVGFLLASALAGAKAEVEKLNESIDFYGVICLSALCARMAHTKGREITTKKNRTEKRKKTRTPRTPPKSCTKRCFGSQNGSKNRSRDPLFRSWRPVSRKIDPKTRPKRSWEPPLAKKHWTRSMGSRVWGAPLTAGGRSESFSNNKQTWSLKLRFAKLEAPLRGAVAATHNGEARGPPDFTLGD